MRRRGVRAVEATRARELACAETRAFDLGPAALKREGEH
jgi:hypothetical protein